MRAAWLLPVAMLAAPFAGCAGSPPSSIEARDLSFAPSAYTAGAGDVVTWRNTGEVTHTVTSDVPGGPLHGTMEPGQGFKFLFDRPGVYAYHCIPHSSRGPDGNYTGMVGTITVKPA